LPTVRGGRERDGAGRLVHARPTLSDSAGFKIAARAKSAANSYRPRLDFDLAGP
jgi:hypothetical protein